MQIQLNPAEQLQLAQVAGCENSGPGTFAQAAAVRVLDEDLRFRAAVQEGIAAADRGELIPDKEAWASVEQIINS